MSRKNPDVKVIKPETVGHWEEGDFVLDQEVAIPGTERILDPGMRIPFGNASLPPGISGSQIVEALLNNTSHQRGEVDGKPAFAVHLSSHGIRFRTRLLLANMIGLTGNGLLYISWCFGATGKLLHRIAWRLIAPRPVNSESAPELDT